MTRYTTNYSVQVNSHRDGTYCVSLVQRDTPAGRPWQETRHLLLRSSWASEEEVLGMVSAALRQAMANTRAIRP